jgi:hypothetical protein
LSVSLGSRAEGAFFGSLTVRRLVEEWWRSEPRLVATTQASYCVNLDNHVLPILGEKKVAEIRPGLVAAFLRHLAEEKGISPPSARSERFCPPSCHSEVSMEDAETNSVMKVPPPELVGGNERVAPTTRRRLGSSWRLTSLTLRSFATCGWLPRREGGAVRPWRCAGGMSTSMLAR